MSVTPPPPSDVPSPAQPALAVEPLACPQCGYDLRGIASDRCPECGLEIDREAALHSLIPWTYRRANGRVRTYLQTVWLMTRGVRRFRDETTRPVSYRDARRFWFVTATLVSLLLIIPAAATSLDRGIEGLLRDQIKEQVMAGAPVSGWRSVLLWDVWLPLGTGLQFAGLLPLMTIAFTFSNMAMLPLLLNCRAAPPTQRARSVALAYYACGPLAWWPILVALTAGLIAARATMRPVGSGSIEAIVWALGMLAVFVIPPLVTWIRSAGLYAALTHGGAAQAVFAGVVLPVVWLLNGCFWLLAIPWAVGGIWVLWRSL